MIDEICPECGRHDCKKIGHVFECLVCGHKFNEDLNKNEIPANVIELLKAVTHCDNVIETASLDDFVEGDYVGVSVNLYCPGTAEEGSYHDGYISDLENVECDIYEGLADLPKKIEKANAIIRRKGLGATFSPKFNVEDYDMIDHEIDDYEVESGDNGIGSYEYWGQKGYDSRPYTIAVNISLNATCEASITIYYGDVESVNESKDDLKRLAQEEKDAIASYDGSIANADSEEEKKLYQHIKDEEKEHYEELVKFENGEDIDLEEDVEIHKTLNPKLWNDHNELLPEVKSKVKEIVDKFTEYVTEKEVKFEVKDIYLLGSNVNYNYNDESDLDIHIMVDESFDCSDKHLNLIYDACKSLFNSKYDIKIKGIEVEVYVENADKTTNVSTGVYSVNKGWIKEPSKYEIPEINNDNIARKVEKLESAFMGIKSDPTPDSISEFIDSLYQMRQTSIQKDGEFGEDNLAFKEFRRRGYVDELKKLKDELTSQELSLEGLNEDFNNPTTEYKGFKIQECNYILQYNGREEPLYFFSINAPGYCIDGDERFPLPLRCHDSLSGPELDFDDLESAKKWIDEFGDNYKIRIMYGKEIHAFPKND